MRFLSGLKRLCDACFYFSFAGFVALLFGGSSLLAALPFFAAAAFLSALLAGRGLLQFAPLALLAGAFLAVPLHPANAAALAPACFLMAHSAAKERKGPRRFEYGRVFKAFLVMSFALMVWAFPLRLWPRLEQSLIPFGVAFAALACVLLRMERHDEQVAREKRLIIFNALSVAGVLLVAFAVGYWQLLGFAGAALGFAYRNAVVPLFLLILHPLALFAHWLLSMIRLPEERVVEPDGDAPPYEQDGVFPEALAGQQVEAIANAAAALLAALAVFILIALLTKLARGAGRAYPGAAHSRSALPGKPRAPSRRASRIRETYRKFLALCRRDGMWIPPHATSLDVERGAALKYGQDGSGELREIYAR